MFTNKTILVTGGTGSFGKEFVKEALTLNPQKVIVFSRDELKQHEMQLMYPNEPRLRFFLGDVRDRDRLYRAFEGVNIVVHAAALKQVPAAEYNPFEFVKTNVMGAQNVADAAIDRNVEKVLALSTDKAVNPINLYGATKLCSDRLLLAANRYSGTHPTKFSVVRYGNVAGSRGSVLPIFLKYRGTDTPVPVTDPSMTRFWISLPQAVKFVIDSLDRMKGGEVFIPKLPTMSITDLVEALDCKYFVSGIRPGEKIHEALIAQEESRDTREFDTYYVIDAQATAGTPVPPNFQYTSDQNQTKLTSWELHSMVSTL